MVWRFALHGSRTKSEERMYSTRKRNSKCQRRDKGWKNGMVFSSLELQVTAGMNVPTA